jgi:hypothetical protein
MAGCGPQEMIVGGVIDKSRILDAEITGGLATNLTLNNALFTGTISFEPGTLIGLANALSPHLTLPLDEEAAAGVFRDCANNLKLSPGMQIATCADLTNFRAETGHILDDFRTETENGLNGFKTDWQNELEQAINPVTLTGHLKAGSGLALAPGTKVATWDELNAQIAAAADPLRIAGVFSNSEGLALAPGTRLMSAEETAAAIRLGVCEGCGSGGGGGGGGGIGMAIDSVTWTPATQTLNIRETDGDTPQNWPVVLSGIKPDFAASAVSPAYDVADALPTAMFGSRGAILGVPNTWLGPFQIGADFYVIPAFKLPS